MAKYKILWIEDQAKSIMGLINPLIESGHKFDIANDFEQASQYLLREQYNLIILDIIIPSGMDKKSIEDFRKINSEDYYGLKFLSKITENSPPILVLTVVNDPEILGQVRNNNKVKEILIKGRIRPSELKEIVLNIIQKEGKTKS